MVRLRPARASVLALALAAIALLAACAGEDAPAGPAETPPMDCAALSDSLFPADRRNGLAQFKVVSPDSGGTFKVGQEMRVVVTGIDYTSALVDLVVYGAGDGVGRVPGFPRQAIDVRKTCEFRFAVPESLTTLAGGRIALVADSVKVRVADYTDGESFDYSDRFFSVIR